MALSKSQLNLIVLTALIAAGGAYYWFNIRETPDTAARRLMAAGIEVSPDSFFKEVKAGHLDSIRNFLKTGASAGTQDDNDVSALMMAVDSDNKDIVSLLLSALGPTPQAAAPVVNLQDKTEGKTALIIAAQKKDKDMVSILLDHGADTAIEDKKLETPLIIAVKDKDRDIVPLLISADNTLHQGNSINEADASGETALTYAIREQEKDFVDRLIVAKADPITADRSSVTPLMIAAEGGNEAIGVRLIEMGAKPDMADRSGNSALSIAISHAHPAFARMLLEKGANPDFHTSGPLPLEAVITTEPFDNQLFTLLLAHSKEAGSIGASAVFDAIDHKNSDSAKALLERGVNPKATNAAGETLLYRAIENGLEDVALLLIDKGANISQTGITGLTPLERATKHNEIKVVNKLLSLGVSPDQKTSEGYTIAEMAVYSGYPEVLDALLAKGAKVEKDFGVLWAIRDGGGRSVPVLIKYGAHPNVMSNSGDSALWLAASAGEVEAVTALIKSHAGLDYPNTAQSMTPLAIASHGGQLAVVKLLVETGANMELADTSGMTPLAHAAYMSKPDVVEYLISKGADVHAADKQGRSISDLAALGEASAARDRVMALLQQGKK